MSRWRANPPPRRTARPSGLRRSGDTRASPAREPARGGARRRPFRESPRAAASFQRRRPTGTPRRRPSPASPPRYGAAERRPDPGGPHSDHTPVLERVLRSEGRVPSPAADPSRIHTALAYTGDRLGVRLGEPGRVLPDARMRGASERGGLQRRPALPRGPRAFTLPTSDQARLPARFKHISKRRKRN